MDTHGNEIPCAFDTLMSKNVPHILEKIFLSVDYKTFKECIKVNKIWRGFLTSESFQVKAKLIFCEGILNEQRELWQAAMWGKVEVAKRILSYVMVDVNCLGGFNDSTPLCEASAFGHTEVAMLLLQNGADPEKPDKLGQTPLYWAAVSDHAELIVLLLDGGADPIGIKTNGTSILHKAAMKGHKYVVELLLEGGADHNSVDTEAVLAIENKADQYYNIENNLKKEYEEGERLQENRREICKIIEAKRGKKRYLCCYAPSSIKNRIPR